MKFKERREQRRREKRQQEQDFQNYVRLIYGDSNLDSRTMNQLKHIWKTNPNIIKQTADQKIQENAPTQKTTLSIPIQNSTIPQNLEYTSQLPSDNLSWIEKFNDAFRVARQKGLKQFEWKGKRYGTELDPGWEFKWNVNGKRDTFYKQREREANNSIKNLNTRKQTDDERNEEYEKQASYMLTMPYGYEVAYNQASLVPLYSWNPNIFPNIPRYENNRGVSLEEVLKMKYQQGGQLNMNEQQLQQAFIQFLAQKTGAKNQQELEAAIQQLGEEGLKQAYAEFMQMIQQQQVQAAKFGAKLNYIKSLRGQCPEGYEISYYKVGGTLCKKCMKKQQEMKDGGQVPKNPIDEFKCGRKMKKAQGGAVDFEKCGGKTKKTKKKEEGGELNSTKNPKAFSKMALAKCGTKLKEACKGMQLNKCGKKLKKKATGGTVSTNKGTGWKPCK